MRTSHKTDKNTASKVGVLTDEHPAGWHPERISDRKLLELATSLERVRRFGGAFAAVGLSDQAQKRLDELQSRR